MYHLTRKKLKPFFVLLILLTLILPPLAPFLTGKANAGSISSAKLQIDNSQSGATSVTYGFFFTASASTAIKQIGIKICTQAGAWGDTCTDPTGFSPGSPTLASDNISGTGRTVSDPNTSGERFRVVVTTPSTQSPLGVFLNFTGVTNSSTTNTTFFARVRTYSDTGTTEIDYGQVAAATLTSTSIAVSATVDPNLTFSIAGVTSGGTVNSATTTVTTAAATIPFGTLTAATPAIGAHDVTITTNAGSGYTVTASHSATISGNPPLFSGATNNIDAFSGTNATPSTWSSPGGSTANVNTGYFGYTTEDATLCIGTAARFTTAGGNKWAGSTTTGDEVVCSTSGVSAQTTRVGWQVEVNTVQPAGVYTGTAILIATPTY